MEKSNIEHTPGRGSITATLFSFLPTSIWLQIDSTAIIQKIDTNYETLIVAGIISVLANLLIKLTDKILLWTYGYKIADWILTKVFKKEKK